MTHPHDTHPLLEAAVERALAPYVDLLPAEALADFREVLRQELARHPVSARLLKQLAPAPVVQQSGERTTGGAPSQPMPVAVPGGSRRGR